MNRLEFMEKLQRALAGGLNSRQVTENVRFYQEYIDVEIRKGRSETEVLTELGDPRLLAKSIIEANKRAGISGGTNQTYDEEILEDGTGQPHSYSYTYRAGQSEDIRGGRNETGGVFRMPGWLILLIVTVVVLLIIGVAFSVIWALAPVIIPVLIIILIIKVFQGKP